MQKQKVIKERRSDLLTKLRINSIEIDMINNGTPLNKIMNGGEGDKGGKGKKIDLAELQRIASLANPIQEETVVEEVNQSKNEFEEIRNQLYEDERKHFHNLVEKSRVNYKNQFKTDIVEINLGFMASNEKDKKKPDKKQGDNDQKKDTDEDLSWNTSAPQF